MGPGGSGLGQVNGGFRSATPNSRYVGTGWGGEVEWEGWVWERNRGKEAGAAGMSGVKC